MVNLEQTHIFGYAAHLAYLVHKSGVKRQSACFDIQICVKSALKYDLIEGVVKTTNQIRPSFWSTV